MKNFVICFLKKAIQKEIAVIGITDYFSIENYNKTIKFVNEIDTNDKFEHEEKEKIKKILLLPNVELRMSPSTGKGKIINIHCIFNNKIVNKLNNDFLDQLNFQMERENIK